MKFGAVAPAEAKGGIVVHSIRKGGLVLKEGSVVGDADIAALRAAGIPSITIARMAGAVKVLGKLVDVRIFEANSIQNLLMKLKAEEC